MRTLKTRTLPLLAMLSSLFFIGCESNRVATELDIASDRIDTSMTNVFGAITSTHRDYNFLLNTGGMIVNAPIPQPDGTYFLPVKADVSGASNITRRPVDYNDKIAVREIVVKQGKGDTNRLYIYLKTAWPTDAAPSPVTRGVNIGPLAPGSYIIEYLNRDGTTVMLGGFRVAGEAAPAVQSPEDAQDES